MSRFPATLSPGDADIRRAMAENSELIRELDEAATLPMDLWPPADDEAEPAHMDARDGLTVTDVIVVLLLAVFSVAAYLGHL